MSVSARAGRPMMAALLVSLSAPPRPSICRRSGLPNRSSSTRVKRSRSPGTSSARRNTPLLVPPRIRTKGSSSRIGLSLADPPEAGNGDLRCHGVKADLHPVANLDLGRGNAHHAADHPWPLFELNQRDVVGYIAGKGRLVDLVEHDARMHAAAPRHGLPSEAAIQAMGADMVDRITRPAAAAAMLQHQALLTRGAPERAVGLVERGQRLAVGGGFGHLDFPHAARRIIALAQFSAMPRPVTRQLRAFLTWRSPHSPRIWRTPSTACSQPSMYDSDRLPPAVFTGNCPPSSIRPPSVNGPPSPTPQKPACSSHRITLIVKLSYNWPHRCPGEPVRPSRRRGRGPPFGAAHTTSPRAPCFGWCRPVPCRRSAPAAAAGRVPVRPRSG